MPKTPVLRMTFEVCILAGGLSRRMGRDKARMRLGGRTLLAHTCLIAERAGFHVRVIRRDAVPRCGPLGGVITALRSTKADVVLFLSCDMPLIPVSALHALRREAGRSPRPVFFADAGQGVGFPFALRVGSLALAERQLGREEFSLQRLAGRSRAVRLAIPSRARGSWLNVNTPEELALARARLQPAKVAGASRKPRLVTLPKAAKLRA